MFVLIWFHSCFTILCSRIGEQVGRSRVLAGRGDPHAQQIMNSHIPKKSTPIWIFCCLRATCSSLDSRFAKTNIKMGSFLQYIYMIKNGSSQVINFYVILGTITCTVYGFLTIFPFAVPIQLRKNQIWEFMILNSPRSGLQTRRFASPYSAASSVQALLISNV